MAAESLEPGNPLRFLETSSFFFFLPQKLIKHDGGFIGFYEVSRKVSKIKGKFLAVEGDTFWSLFNFTAMM